MNDNFSKRGNALCLPMSVVLFREQDDLAHHYLLGVRGLRFFETPRGSKLERLWSRCHLVEFWFRKATSC